MLFLIVSKVLVFLSFNYRTISCVGEGESSEVFDRIEQPELRFNPRAIKECSEDFSDLYRLPTNIKPIHYDLQYHFSQDNSIFYGKLVANVFVWNSTNKIILHARKLKISKLSIYKQLNYSVGTVSSVPIKSVCRWKEHDYFVINLNDPAEKFTNLLIHSLFTGKVSSGLNGIYSATYTKPNGDIKNIISTHFEPDHAREAFPCFDDPSFKAVFTLTLIHSINLTSTSNTPIESESEFGDSLRSTIFKPTPLMSTYLLVFAVHDFVNISHQSKNNLMLSVWLPEHLVSQGSFALNLSVRALSLFENLFQLKYPLEKVDMIGIPDFEAGAMENWGMITFRMQSLLVEENVTTLAEKQWISITVVHELAHQWFGNLVTMEWWNDLWLNEGFATYMEHYAVDKLFPEWHFMDQILIFGTYNAMSFDQLSVSHPVASSDTEKLNLKMIFDPIAYFKAASLLKMLNNLLGDDIFFKSLSKYLTKFRFGNAKSSDLWKVMEETSKRPQIVEIMKSYTTTVGYPAIYVSLTGPNTIQLSQSKFYILREGQNDNIHNKSDVVWIIPLQYTTSMSPNKVEDIILDKPKDILTLTNYKNGSWIKFNTNGSSYSRVFYDAPLRSAIIDTLKTNHSLFTVMDRTALISDAFAATRCNFSYVDVLFNMCAYLEKELFYMPWYEASIAFFYIDNVLWSSSLQLPFRKYIKSLISKLDTESEREEIDSNLRFLKILKYNMGLHFKNKHEILSLKRAFDEWNINHTKVKEDFMEHVLCTGMTYGSDNDWNKLYDLFRETTDPTLETRYLFALSCSRNENNLQKLLLDTLNTTIIRSQDSPTLIVSISNKEKGRSLVWNFLGKYWSEIQKIHEDSQPLLGQIILGVISKYSSKKFLPKVKRFLKEKSTKAINRDFKEALESYENNIEWLDLNQEALTKWLKSRAY